MKICIPTFTDEGLDSVPYTHFGSASYFVLHDTETGETKVIRNRNEHHEHGACNPLHELDGEEVDTILVGGIGRRAFARLHATGMRVFQAQDGSIRDNVEAFQQGKLTEFTPETACRGHGHGGGPSDHDRQDRHGRGDR